MKTSDVSSNRPVQQNTDQSKAAGKKPQKEFKEVLDKDGVHKKEVGSKKKPFSPLSKGEAKETMMKSAKPPAGGHERVESKADRESLGELEAGIGGKGKKGHPGDLGDFTPQIQQMMGPQGMSAAAQVEKTTAPGGLNLEELQSIVNKVQVGVNEKGLPEMKFEIQTEKLGTMNLDISADGNDIKIKFVTDDINTQQVMEENLKELSNLLQEKGLNLAETNFSTRDQEKQEQQQQQQEQAWEGPAYTDLPTGRPKKGFSL